MMRNILARFTLWLASRCGLVLMDETRVAMGSDAKARADRWEQFAREEGGLYDMIDTLRREAFEQFAECAPDARAQRDYIAMSDRNLRRLKQRVQSIIATGKIEATRDAQRVDMRIVKSA